MKRTSESKITNTRNTTKRTSNTLLISNHVPSHNFSVMSFFSLFIVSRLLTLSLGYFDVCSGYSILRSHRAFGNGTHLFLYSHGHNEWVSTLPRSLTTLNSWHIYLSMSSCLNSTPFTGQFFVSMMTMNNNNHNNNNNNNSSSTPH